jgi:hypothetical protein
MQLVIDFYFLSKCVLYMFRASSAHHQDSLAVHKASSFLCLCLSAALSCKKLAFSGASVCIDRLVACIHANRTTICFLLYMFRKSSAHHQESLTVHTCIHATNQSIQTGALLKASFLQDSAADRHKHRKLEAVCMVRDSWWWALDARNM